MLGSLKRFFSGQGFGPDLNAVADWARQAGHRYKRARDDEGFIVDGSLDGKPWRLEWGPSQRSYITGHELRMRMELGLPSDAQWMLLSRPLMEVLEKQAFELYTEVNQTQIDTASPEEVRWLVIHSKVNMSTLKTLRAGVAAVANVPSAGLAWIEGALAHQFERALAGPLGAEAPFVMMTLRGRLYLRLALAQPELAAITGTVELFETAAVQAARLTSLSNGAASDWPTTGSALWQSLQPTDSTHGGRS